MNTTQRHQIHHLNYSPPAPWLILPDNYPYNPRILIGDEHVWWIRWCKVHVHFAQLCLTKTPCYQRTPRSAFLYRRYIVSSSLPLSIHLYDLNSGTEPMGIVSRQLISFLFGDGIDKMIVLDREMRDGSARASGGCSC